MKPRYSIIPGGASTDPDLEGNDLRVLCFLGEHTDKLGWCFLSQGKIAAALHIGRATVQRSLGRLAAGGYVEIKSSLVSGRPHACHAYRVIMDRDDPEIAPSDAEVEDQIRDEGCPPAGTPVPIQDGQGCPSMDGHGVPTHTRAHNDQDSAAAVEAARARDPMISETAWTIARNLAVIAGHQHDPPDWPTTWCGAPMRVQGWLNEGWTEPLIVIGARKAASRKPPGTIKTIEFFEGAIADEIVRQARPLPKGVPDEIAGSDRPSRQSAGSGFAAIAVARARESGRT